MMDNDQIVILTADIVSAHVASNHVALGDVSNLVQQVHGALSALASPKAALVEAKKAVVSVKASIKPDYITCMECGAKQKTLKRHLMTAHDMTPDQYRAEYGLPREYPMTAPNYSKQRQELAKKLGLGRKARGQRKRVTVNSRSD